MSSIAVIGSGVAGLASAALAANKGYDVSVFEANSVSWEERQVKFVRKVFDLTGGPRFLRCLRCLMKFLYHVAKILRTIIATPDFLSLQNIFILMAKCFMPTLKAEDFAKEFERVFGERSEHVLEYLHHAQKVFELTEEVFLKHPLRKAWRYIPKHVLPKAASLRRLKAFTTLNALHKKFLLLLRRYNCLIDMLPTMALTHTVHRARWQSLAILSIITEPLSWIKGCIKGTIPNTIGKRIGSRISY